MLLSRRTTNAKILEHHVCEEFEGLRKGQAGEAGQ